MGPEALDRVETQWGRPFQCIKKGNNHCFVTNRKVVESGFFQDEFVSRFNADLAVLEEEVREQALRLKRGRKTWSRAMGAGSLLVPAFKSPETWLEVAPFYMKG